MGSMYDKVRISPELETSGVVLDYGDYRVTIARAGGTNKRFQKVLEAKSRPYMRAIQTDAMSNERAEQIMLETYAEAVILNWELKQDDGSWKPGIELPNGDIAAFNKENVLAVISDPALSPVWNDIKSQSTKDTLFRASVLEALAGN